MKLKIVLLVWFILVILHVTFVLAENRGKDLCAQLEIKNVSYEILNLSPQVLQVDDPSRLLQRPYETLPAINARLRKFYLDNCAQVGTADALKDFVKRAGKNCIDTCRFVPGLHERDRDEYMATFCYPLCQMYISKIDGLFDGYQKGVQNCYPDSVRMQSR